MKSPIRYTTMFLICAISAWVGSQPRLAFGESMAEGAEAAYEKFIDAANAKDLKTIKSLMPKSDVERSEAELGNQADSILQFTVLYVPKEPEIIHLESDEKNVYLIVRGASVYSKKQILGYMALDLDASDGWKVTDYLFDEERPDHNIAVLLERIQTRKVQQTKTTKAAFDEASFAQEPGSLSVKGFIKWEDTVFTIKDSLAIWFQDKNELEIFFFPFELTPQAVEAIKGDPEQVSFELNQLKMSYDLLGDMEIYFEEGKEKLPESITRYVLFIHDHSKPIPVASVNLIGSMAQESFKKLAFSMSGEEGEIMMSCVGDPGEKYSWDIKLRSKVSLQQGKTS